jgi:hypothetical protein
LATFATTAGNGVTATSGSALYYGARAWVNFVGYPTVSINAQSNVSSITDNGVGDYTVNISTALPNANYAVVATGMYAYDLTLDGGPYTAPTTKTTSACRLYAGDGYTGTRVDITNANVIFMN